MRYAVEGYKNLRLGPLVLLLQLALISAGCAGMTAGAGAPRSSFNSVTGDELRDSVSNDLYAALQDLRPQWFRPRPRASITFATAQEPVVYVSGVREGSLDTLRGLDLLDVVSVEFIDPLDASTRYGTGHSGGVILVDMDRF